MDRCTCPEPASPGTVRIAVFCIDCHELIGEISGDIEEQIARLKDVAEDMRIVREVKEISAEVQARQYDGSGSAGHTVTCTEGWSDESFRPFG